MDTVRSFEEVRTHLAGVFGALSPFLPYIVTIVSVGIIPLALAGIGGHLAAVALPENPKSRRRWKWLVWGLAIAGIALFSYSQYLAYRSDQDRDAKQTSFQNGVLTKLDVIANEPNRKKRQDAVAELAAKLTSNSPSLPAANHTPKPNPTASPSNPVQQVAPVMQAPPQTSQSPSAPVQQNTVAVCPADGQLALLWNIRGGTNPTFTYDINPSVRQTLHPALNGMIRIEDVKSLTPEQLADYSNLTKDLQPLIPKPQPIRTPQEPISPEVSFETLVHDFREDSIVRYWYYSHLSTGDNLGGTMSTVPISSLSKNGRRAIQDFDNTAKSLADLSCRNAMDRLTAKGQ